jgi:hypothetical protein
MKKLALILMIAVSSIGTLAFAAENDASCEATTDTQSKDVKEGVGSADSKSEGTVAAPITGKKDK